MAATAQFIAVFDSFMSLEDKIGESSDSSEAKSADSVAATDKADSKSASDSASNNSSHSNGNSSSERGHFDIDSLNGAASIAVLARH